jgi:hypothetical protein
LSIYFIFLPALALFLVPCVLPRRWLWFYAPLAAIGLTLLWRDHFAHQHEGNGFAVAMAEAIIFGWTVSAIVGVATRLVIIALRAWRVRWRYAWLPAPFALALLIASPWLLYWYGEFERRPPSDECLAATHRLEIAGEILSVPSAPIFTMFRAINAKDIYSLAWPASARAFCRLTAQIDPLPIQLLKLDFGHVPTSGYRWEPRLCEAVRDRPWLRQLCDGPAPRGTEHYPKEIEFEPADRMASGAFRELWTSYSQARTAEAPAEEATDNSVAWRLRTADGTPLAVSCRHYDRDLTSCYAIFEPRPGLAARFRLAVRRDQVAAEAIAIQARVAEIARDLLRP